VVIGAVVIIGLVVAERKFEVCKKILEAAEK